MRDPSTDDGNDGALGLNALDGRAASFYHRFGFERSPWRPAH